MKAILLLILLMGILACAGCTSATTAPLVTTGIPSLTGNWTGTVKGYGEGTGYFESNSGSLDLRITEQKDRLFSGQLFITESNGSVSTRQFAGALCHDGKSFTLVQFDSGYDLGTVLSDNEIEMVYMNDKKPAFLVIDSFTRAP
ncbi:MAG: hypothetical protein WC620_09225 [Methanoregula sp.]|jgi:hypothetical protein